MDIKQCFVSLSGHNVEKKHWKAKSVGIITADYSRDTREPLIYENRVSYLEPLKPKISSRTTCTNVCFSAKPGKWKLQYMFTRYIFLHKNGLPEHCHYPTPTYLHPSKKPFYNPSKESFLRVEVLWTLASTPMCSAPTVWCPQVWHSFLIHDQKQSLSTKPLF